MALTDMMPSFVWGAGGAQMTPEQIARERAIADALVAQGINTSPVGHWTQGLARVANAAAGAFRGGAANEAERAGRADWQSRLASTLAGTGSGGAATATPTAPSVPFAGASGGNLDSYLASVRQAESGGNVNARNPSSSATGLYQFTTPTWNNLMRSRPDLALTADGRLDPVQQERAMRAFTEQNASSLTSAGIQPTPGNLYAAHFLGAGGARSALSQSDATPMANAVGPGVVKANPFLANMTVGDFKAWTNRKAGGGAAPPASGGGMPSTADLLKLATDPFAPRGAQGLIGSLMQHQIQQNDPLRQLQMQKLQSDIARTTGAGPGTQAFQTLHQRALASGLQQGSPEYQRFMAAGGKSPDNTAKEQQIARMEGIGVPRNVAIGIADGVYKADRHPVTGELQVVDMSTGRPIYGGPQQRRQEQTPQPVPFTGGSQQFGQQFENAPASFGLEGAARGLANTAFDVAGMPVPYRDVQQTQADFRVLQESLVNDLESAYSGRVPSWMLKNLRDLTPSPGSPFEGSETARTKLNAMGRQLQSELTITEQSLSRELSPKNRQDAEAKISALRSGISRVGAALQSFGAPPSQPQGQAAPQQQPQVRDGQTATNPQTGEKVVFRNGKWEKM